MKVVCIKNVVKSGGGHFSYSLTIGKCYDYNSSFLPDSIFLDYDSYWIKNDMGDYYCYSKALFITVKEYRKQKLNKIVSTYENRF